jgi:hypothetical protein
MSHVCRLTKVASTAPQGNGSATVAAHELKLTDLDRNRRFFDKSEEVKHATDRGPPLSAVGEPAAGRKDCPAGAQHLRVTWPDQDIWQMTFIR